MSPILGGERAPADGAEGRAVRAVAASLPEDGTGTVRRLGTHGQYAGDLLPEASRSGRRIGRIAAGVNRQNLPSTESRAVDCTAGQTNIGTVAHKKCKT